MDKSLINTLTEYLDKVLSAGDLRELRTLETQYRPALEALSPDMEEGALIDRIFSLSARMLDERGKLLLAEKDAPQLSDPEKAENDLVQELLDRNLFTYHFQPIVRVDNGEIYAYEALMRAGDIKGITPFHILKYAELTGRLYEVEQYTFLNVLRLAAAKRDFLAGRPIFINSMPNVHMLPDKAAEIEELLRACEGVVVEMVESSEYDDGELTRIKEKYSRLGIPIAIDDFGTGYSNISNLLRYTPNFVKIDRSLLSGIEASPNKKHFVREIIDFCHANGIMALAEGVENAEELRTVILLGVDLIQGYYTARPSPELIEAIPFEIRAEMRACRQEREDGRRLRVYKAEPQERISLERLQGEGYSAIHIGFREGDITVTGSVHLESGIHIDTAEGFHGTLTLENAWLSNLTERPCIDLGDHSHMTLVLVGSNRLDNSGIRVPPTSMLTTAGNGDLDIRLGNADYYGIGNDMLHGHGMLEFRQDGTISITARSHAGICIGAGMGGDISIGRGRYALTAAGSSNIGIGSYSGETRIDILGCDFECEAAGAYSVVIGTVTGRAEIHMMYSSIRWTSDSMLATGLGSLHGEASRVHAESVSITAEMSADILNVFGSQNGDSQVIIERSSVRATADGKTALLFGGELTDASTILDLTDIDITAKIATELNVTTHARPDNVHISGGRYRIELNGRLLENI